MFVLQEADDYQTRKALIDNLVKQHGGTLIQGIIDACVFHLPSYMMPDHAQILFDLMQIDRQVRMMGIIMSSYLLCHHKVKQYTRLVFTPEAYSKYTVKGVEA